MGIKVCKFGGSSVKNSLQIKKVIDIVKDDNNRRVIVVSALGRDEYYDEKIFNNYIYINNSYIDL